MRIAIVDDIAEERSLLRSRLESQIRARHLSVHIFEYESSEAFLAAAKEEAFTAAFLDIYMDGMTGIEAAKELRQFDSECLLAFTTTSTDHALEGFRVRALHYLVKPYDEEEVGALLEEILRHVPKPDKHIAMKVNGSNMQLSFRDIISAEHYAHQIHVKTISGRTFVTRQSFGEFTTPLKTDERFFVCGRGIIINMEHATDIGNGSFTMDDGSTVGISRDLQKSARQAFMDYLFKRGHGQ